MIKTKLVLSVIGILFAAFFLFNIEYSPLWLFTRYRKLRPFILAQKDFESNAGQSSLSRRAFNYFGMRVPSKRFSWRTGETNNYSKYLFPVFSLIDLFTYFNYVDFPTDISNVNEYAYELKRRGYFTANLWTYQQGLQQYL